MYIPINSQGPDRSSTFDVTLDRHIEHTLVLPAVVDHLRTSGPSTMLDRVPIAGAFFRQRRAAPRLGAIATFQSDTAFYIDNFGSRHFVISADEAAGASEILMRPDLRAKGIVNALRHVIGIQLSQTVANGWATVQADPLLEPDNHVQMRGPIAIIDAAEQAIVHSLPMDPARVLASLQLPP